MNISNLTNQTPAVTIEYFLLSETPNAFAISQIIENEKINKKGVDIVSDVLGSEFRNVLNRMTKTDEHTDDYMNDLAIEYFKFLLLNREINGGIVPSKNVDDLWHTHILFTKHYEMTCTKLFKKFLHHTPAITSYEKDNYITSYNDTLEKYKQVFRQNAPTNIWPESKMKVNNEIFGCRGCG